MVSLKLENESLAPELLHAQSKRPSQYRFTVPLIVPSYPYSCGLRALIRSGQLKYYIKKITLNIRFLHNKNDH